MVAKSGASTVKPALLIGPKLVNHDGEAFENCCWMAQMLGEGESAVLVLWVASKVGRESGKSFAWMSIQATCTRLIGLITFLQSAHVLDITSGLKDKFRCWLQPLRNYRSVQRGPCTVF